MTVCQSEGMRISAGKISVLQTSLNPDCSNTEIFVRFPYPALAPLSGFVAQHKVHSVVHK